MKFGIVVFPGSNCDHDAYYVAKKIIDEESIFLWHKENDLQGSDVIILPGGFSYGDYLRTGAIAKFSPIMNSVIDFANKGGIVIGICNGFQILLETGLLPGVMLKNESLKFICKDVYLKVENKNTVFTNKISEDVLKIPIAHGELQENNQIVFKYSSPEGETTKEFNPNGSKLNIAGIVNKNGNVLGMMPHPERSSDSSLHKTDGIGIFHSITETIKSKVIEV